MLPSFAVPAALAALLTLPVVVLLHRWRSRRPRHEVAGTFLWERARARTAAHPRWRATLLLLLQLLAVTALALAAARPYLPGDEEPLRVLVIDGSATLAARDGQTSPAASEYDLAAELPADATRLDVAREIARELAARGGRIALLQGGREPRFVLAATRDRDAIDQALASLTALDGSRDVLRALELARDAVQDEPEGSEIHWLSDHPPPARNDVVVHDLAGGGTNLGISGLERIGTELWIHMTNTAPRPAEAQLELRREGQRRATSTLIVPAGGEATTTLPAPVGRGALELRIAANALEGDVLPLDDVAWLSEANVDVALGAPFASLERALAALDDVAVRIAPAAASASADLRFLAEEPPAPLPSGLTVTYPPVDAPALSATVRTVAATSPLLRYVELDDLTVAYVPPPATAADTVLRGAEEVLVTGNAAGESVPLVTLERGAEGDHLRLHFHPDRGAWTRTPAFPAFVTNLVGSVRNADRLPLGHRFATPALHEGEPTRLADAPGAYRFEGRTLYASLVSREASDVPRAESAGGATVGGEATAVASGTARSLAEPLGWSTPVPGREWTVWLLALALAALLTEAALARKRRRA